VSFVVIPTWYTCIPGTAWTQVNMDKK
jgi:hypothetical protein